MQSQVEHLQSKYIGTGHADLTKYEWVVNQHRDSAASYVGHPSLLSGFAIAQGTSVVRERLRVLNRMLAPCGPPPVPAETLIPATTQQDAEEP